MDNSQVTTALQTVVSPVVLISGVGMLVLSMTNRYSHATNRVRALADAWRKSDGAATDRIGAQIHIFRRRLNLLMVAIALGLGSVFFTALMILAIYASYVFETPLRGTILTFLTLTLVTLVISLALFIRDMSLSLHALREELRDVT
jgi:hypothetical protein